MRQAVERFEDVSSRHKSSLEDFGQARSDARDATAKFNNIKRKRCGYVNVRLMPQSHNKPNRAVLLSCI